MGLIWHFYGLFPSLCIKNWLKLGIALSKRGFMHQSRGKGDCSQSGEGDQWWEKDGLFT
jgi:hypothetical protein